MQPIPAFATAADKITVPLLCQDKLASQHPALWCCFMAKLMHSMQMSCSCHV